MHKKIIVKFNSEELTNLVNNENSCVKLCKSNYSLALYPHHLADISTSIKDLLNVGLAKYDKKLDGILLSYKNIKILRGPGVIVSDSFYIHIDIEADFYMFKPDVGCTLTGIVNKKSNDHVGCLVHRLFNVSVPSKSDDPDWLGNYVEIGEEVLLKITYINLEASLPYIRASFVSNKKRKKKKKSRNSGLIEDNLNITDNHKTPNKKKNKKKHHECNTETETNEPDLISNVKQKHHKHKHKEISYEDNNESVEVSKYEDIRNTKKKKSKKHHALEEPGINDLSETFIKKKKGKQIEEIETVQHTNENELNISATKKKKHKKDKDNTLNLSNTEIDEASYHKRKHRSVSKDEDISDSRNNSRNEEENMEYNMRKKKKHKNKKEKIAVAGEKDVAMETAANSSTEKLSDNLDTSVKKHKKKKHKSNMDTDDFNISFNGLGGMSRDPFVGMADLEDCINKKKYKTLRNQNISWNDADLNLSDTEIEKTLEESYKKNSSIDKSRNTSFEDNSVSQNISKKKKKKSSDFEYDEQEMNKIKQRKIRKKQRNNNENSQQSREEDDITNTFSHKKHKSKKSKYNTLIKFAFNKSKKNKSNTLVNSRELF